MNNMTISDPRYGESQLFEAFLRTAQYFARINTQQDVWDHLGKFITAYFPAEWIAFAREDQVDGSSIHYCTMQDAAAVQCIFTSEVRAVIADVLDSGFLASHVILTPAPSRTVFLPIVEEYQTEFVMLIGHKTTDSLPNELLNIYLAIAGLAGTTLERLHNELELNRHRAHLEELVKERTTELAKAKRQNDLILHSVGEGVVGVDLDGRITFVNPFASQMLGWDPNELIGRNAHATFHHTQPSGCPYPSEEYPVNSALTNRVTKNATGEEFSRRDGTRFPVEFTTAPLMDEDNITGAVIVFRDITERKRIEKALLDAKSQAELYVDLMGHDINNMNQIGMGFLELAQETLNIDENGQSLLSKSMLAFEGSTKLIDNVRKLQKVKSGEPHETEMDIGQVLKDVQYHYSHLHGRNVSISYVPVIGYVVRANELLYDLFSNLIGNSIKHSNGSPVINIKVEQLQKNNIDYFKVSIDDNGPGIPDGLKPLIFNRRLNGSLKARGSGIGLFLVKTLVDNYSGIIWVEDRIHGDHTKGAKFVVMLPASNK
jgi:PAS domain S-box-containing protein